MLSDMLAHNTQTVLCSHVHTEKPKGQKARTDRSVRGTELQQTCFVFWSPRIVRKQRIQLNDKFLENKEAFKPARFAGVGRGSLQVSWQLFFFSSPFQILYQIRLPGLKLKTKSPIHLVGAIQMPGFHRSKSCF